MNTRTQRDGANPQIKQRIEMLHKKISATPLEPELYNNLAICHGALNAFDAAIVNFQRAIDLCPTYGEAWFNLGSAFENASAFDKAYAAYVQAALLVPCYKEAAANIARIGATAGLATKINSPWPEPSIARRTLARLLQSRAKVQYEPQLLALPHVSEDDLRSALARNPTSVPNLLVLAEFLFSKRRYIEAQHFAEYCKGFIPTHPGAAVILAEIHEKLGNLRGAYHALSEAVADVSNARYVVPRYLGVSLRLSLWERYATDRAAAIKVLKNYPGAIDPFSALLIGVDNETQKNIAEDFTSKVTTNIRPVSRTPKQTATRKIKIGYISSDFHNHPVAHLIAEVFELHNRKDFVVEGYALWTDDGSDMRRRIRRSFDNFNEVWGASDHEIAMHIEASAVDILIDLNGYTANCRPGVLARKPAPIQVNYLGYPGSMGADFMDYAIVDETVIPPKDAGFFTEKLIYMPDSYQANDRQRRIGDCGSRKTNGLPDKGFVFCCFNANSKITPDVFDIWMRVLKAVPDSVIWLFSGGDIANNHMRQEASDRGVDAGRLIFAPRVDGEKHIARYCVADLSLDTWPYNAHTTASDALWAGCPVITCAGDTFPARVAASLLKAVGLPELIATSPIDYERLVVEYALDSDKLTIARGQLNKREALPLFNTPQFVTQLEEAYKHIVKLQREGLPPRTFLVKDLI